MQISWEDFGTTIGGERVKRFFLRNEAGMGVSILNYGCTVQSITVPDKDGRPVDVVLGYDDLAGYEAGSCFFGAFVGRYANRIKGASFELNGKCYNLHPNDGENHLHGVYSRQVFDASIENGTLVLRRISPDGEEGYPGTLSLEVRYTLSADNALWMEYSALAEKDTILNLTNHSYFNLNGEGDILHHALTLDADAFTHGDSHTLPTGSILSVEGTPLDFRAGKALGTDITSQECEISAYGGYDHNYVLNGTPGTLRRFAVAEGDQSGVRLLAYTTEPGVQLYTGNHIHRDQALCGKNGVRYPRWGGFCLEAQHYPCSPNYPHFPSTVLHGGERYVQQTVYQFEV